VRHVQPECNSITGFVAVDELISEGLVAGTLAAAPIASLASLIFFFRGLLFPIISARGTER
jgi:hypothetical protein